MPLAPLSFFFFFFNDTATTEIYTLSLHDALPISARQPWRWERRWSASRRLQSGWCGPGERGHARASGRSLRPDRVREERSAVVVDDPHGEPLALDGDLAEVVDAAAGEERAPAQALVQRARPARRRRQRPRDELVEREARRGGMADHLGVVHVGGDEDDVLDRAI